MMYYSTDTGTYLQAAGASDHRIASNSGNAALFCSRTSQRTRPLGRVRRGNSESFRMTCTPVDILEPSIVHVSRTCSQSGWQIYIVYDVCGERSNPLTWTSESSTDRHAPACLIRSTVTVTLPPTTTYFVGHSVCNKVLRTLPALTVPLGSTVLGFGVTRPKTHSTSPQRFSACLSTKEVSVYVPSNCLSTFRVSRPSQTFVDSVTLEPLNS